MSRETTRAVTAAHPMNAKGSMPTGTQADRTARTMPQTAIAASQLR